MNKTIKGISIGAIILFALVKYAYADNKEYKLFYINKSGSQIEATKALLAAVNGEQIYKCQSVESKVSKAGTSIGLHNIKKPKAE